MGRRSTASRASAGILCVDKPAGLSSRDVVNLVAGLARHNRVGHAGTLDPLATGVLVVCLGWATRLVPLLHEQTKRYRAVFRLGATSDTDDVTGTVVESSVAGIPRRMEVESLLPQYTGRFLQVPPNYSAVHTDGVRAYEKARRGEPTDLLARPVHVYELTLTAYEYPRLELEIACGSGTYIRSIGRDLGRDLGCGAVMSGLVRTAVGAFTLDRAVAPQSLDRANWRDAVLPPRTVLEHAPWFICGPRELELLSNGRALAELGAFGEESTVGSAPDGAAQRVALTSAAGDLIAAGLFDASRRVIQPTHVFPDALREARDAEGRK